MNLSVKISSSASLDFESLLSFMGMEGDLELHPDYCFSHQWVFLRPKHSTTLFLIRGFSDASYMVCMDAMASYADYQFFPYLVDSLAQLIEGEVEGLYEGESIFDAMDEAWREETIGNAVADFKAQILARGFYLFVSPLEDNPHFTTEVLADYGVTLHSSSSRIYGYVQHILAHKLYQATPIEELESVKELDAMLAEDVVMVDIPQHVSVGKMKSWDVDGNVTYDSFSQEDVDLLLALGEQYRQGKHLEAVVLNDIGSLFHEGVGVAVDAERAIYWYGEALSAGDTLYAPANLGDLYRNGVGKQAASLPKALEAYLLSTDPYAYYRIGQAYEEGWGMSPDMDEAMKWYAKAADKRHHLALKRLRLLPPKD